jgi:four helix bundle protein
MKTYKELIVWQKAMSLVVQVYECALGFPKEELFGLTSQIKRSSVSVPSNISEGFGREHRRDFLRFLRISRGSLFELQTQLMLADELYMKKNINMENLLMNCTELEKMLNKLISYVGKTINNNKQP